MASPSYSDELTTVQDCEPSTTMASQSDFTRTACRNRAYSLGTVVGALWKRRRHESQSAFSGTGVLLFLASRVERDLIEHDRILYRSNRISSSCFAFNFNAYGDQECFHKFRFTKRDVERMVRAVAWPSGQTHTKSNRYSVTPMLATCLVLRRVSSPARWTDLEFMFGKQRPHLSEIYWEALECIWNAHGDLIYRISPSYMAENAQRFTRAIHDKCQGLLNCVAFIDGTVIGIARPKGQKRQRDVYNGHKRKHALKYQAVNIPDGMILHACGPIEGRHHDWTLYIRSDLDTMLPAVLQVGNRRYCVYGDSGYNRCWYLEVPFQGSNLTQAQKAFNKAMSSVRISVEWIFKEVKLHFTILDFKRKMKLSEGAIGLLFRCCMFLSNYRNCVYPSQISQYFNCQPPTLEEYLDMHTEE